jgi:hypothetical protein
MLPDFFARYAETRGVKVVEGSFLFSARDTRRFSTDTKAFPEEAPARGGGFLARKLRRLGRLLVMPALKESWPRTSINVTFRKPIA